MTSSTDQPQTVVSHEFSRSIPGKMLLALLALGAFALCFSWIAFLFWVGVRLFGDI